MDLGIQIQLTVLQLLEELTLVAAAVLEQPLQMQRQAVLEWLSLAMLIVIHLRLQLGRLPMQIQVAITFTHILAQGPSSSTKVKHGTLC
jgi:hypothetical protein